MTQEARTASQAAVDACTALWGSVLHRGGVACVVHNDINVECGRFTLFSS